MIHRGTERLILREWRASDRDLFREINADPKVMEFFPHRRTHRESDAALARVNDMIRATGYGFYALELRETSEPMGFCGIGPVDLPGIFPLGTLEIGWRLATRFWGNGYVSEAGKSLLKMAFEEKQTPEIVAFAVKDNYRSTAVMERLGMRRDEARDFKHPKVPDSHPHLQHHVTYALTRQEWQAS